MPYRNSNNTDNSRNRNRTGFTGDVKGNSDFSFEIVEHLGVINVNARGWSRELNLVSWNGNQAKYDIRDWDPDHVKMGKGVTFTEEELFELGDLITLRLSEVEASEREDGESLTLSEAV